MWKPWKDVVSTGPMHDVNDDDDDDDKDEGDGDDDDVCRTGVVNAPRLVARSHPLPLTEAEGIVLDVFLEILAALFLLVPLCFLAAAYCINPGASSPPGPPHLPCMISCQHCCRHRLKDWCWTFSWRWWQTLSWAAMQQSWGCSGFCTSQLPPVRSCCYSHRSVHPCSAPTPTTPVTLSVTVPLCSNI